LAETAFPASSDGVRVSETMATSSMPRPTIIGSGMPTGIRSRLARTLSCTRRIAESVCVPTMKRAVTSTLLSEVCE
jgi:hypothetical protein